ncbi:hypothetical protein [Paracoccus sp. (in: a-proteobacteria)]|uniref:hypothetical protein n=1 Tax=Paracoccus sp. TaxID=267 RepID=UPI00272CFE80|nr:hypothetical protein [Paracoccus sp. (in: a-proteobacteria)]
MHGRSPWARAALLPTGLVLALLAAPEVRADLLSDTHLIDIRTGSARSDLVRRIRSGGYELADGTPLSLRVWYLPDMPELTVMMLTEVTPSFGITWGFSTGEGARKYSIAPALHLGFSAHHALSPNAVLSLSAGTVLGGRLSERPCDADYGPFGVMPVNCRLAASTLPPEETLDYLLDRDGATESWVSLRFEYRF